MLELIKSRLQALYLTTRLQKGSFQMPPEVKIRRFASSGSKVDVWNCRGWFVRTEGNAVKPIVLLLRFGYFIL